MCLCSISHSYFISPGETETQKHGKSDTSSTDSKWLKDCHISVSPTGEMMVIANKHNMIILNCKFDSYTSFTWRFVCPKIFSSRFKEHSILINYEGKKLLFLDSPSKNSDFYTFKDPKITEQKIC